MIRHRVLMLDSANRRLLWREAIKNATARPALPQPNWWQMIVRMWRLWRA